jgi:hypothetical protein
LVVALVDEFPGISQNFFDDLAVLGYSIHLTISCVSVYGSVTFYELFEMTIFCRVAAFERSPAFQRREERENLHSRVATVERRRRHGISPPDSLFLRTCAQSSLRDWRIKIALFPALKRRATLKSRYAAGESNLKISDKVTES